MNEDLVNKTEINALLNKEPEQEQEVTYSPEEEAALKEGWKPEDQYEGEDGKWVDAGEFMRRKSLFDKIHNQSRELKKMKETLKVMSEHHKRVYEDSYKQALNDLKMQRNAAVEEGDAIAVMEIDKAINTTEKNFQEEAKKFEQPNEPSPDFEDWVQSNQWYKDSPKLRARADELGIRFAQSNPTLPDSDVFDYVSERIKQEYPDMFGVDTEDEGEPTNKRRSSPVEKGSNIRRNTKTKTVQLTPVEQQVMRTLVAGGTMTEEQYKAEIAKMRDR